MIFTQKPSTFVRFLGYVKPYTNAVVLASVGGVVKFTVPLFVPQLTRYLIDHVFRNGALPAAAKFKSLLLLIGVMVAVYLFIWTPFTYVRHYFAGKAGHRSVFDLRSDLYFHILRMSSSFFNANRSGAIVSRLMNDTSQAQNLVGSALTNVWIDGTDIRSLRLQTLRHHIGIVLQDPVLFSGTIRDNICYGKPAASEREIVEACRMANAWEFISMMEGRLDTEIGERGVLLSGGQKQRLTIARAFLKDPRILILDEATSALDSESESLIQEALERLMVGRTTFIIAHRLSTIAAADLILVVKRGQIAEAGRHEELLAGSGVYRSLYDFQFAHIAGPGRHEPRS